MVADDLADGISNSSTREDACRWIDQESHRPEFANGTPALSPETETRNWVGVDTPTEEGTRTSRGAFRPLS
jgi:hypothetical protein